MSENEINDISKEPTQEVVTYQIPETQSVFIDTETNSVVEVDELTPMQKIIQACKLSNVDISEPKKSCKSCNGLGYVSVLVQTGRPIVCRCLFRHLSKDDAEKQFNVLGAMRNYNRKERRAMERSKYKL